ncbi:hypothetical protein [Bacillus sp. FJAT-22090]|uniref:hypothetical protein n=1 Tax=Bacillus sp. FJAT-22090 TaxID=1581038 RepID=UPI00119D1A5C|nr:hypothetical protein [Bacillus sp. FJAT-22090]
MNGIYVGILKFLVIDIRKPFFIFWSIYIATIILGIIIGFSFEDANIFYLNSIPIYIFVAIIGYQSLRSSFPNLIQWGATRKIYFLVTSIFFVLFSFLMSVVNNIFLELFVRIVKWLALTSIHFSSFGQFTDITDTFISRTYIDFSICLAITSIALFVSTILFRCGLVISSFFIMPIVVVTFIPSTSRFIVTFIQNFFGVEGILYFFYLLLFSLLLFLFSWMVMRRAFIIPTK